MAAWQQTQNANRAVVEAQAVLLHAQVEVSSKFNTQPKQSAAVQLGGSQLQWLLQEMFAYAFLAEVFKGHSNFTLLMFQRTTVGVMRNLTAICVSAL